MFDLVVAIAVGLALHYAIMLIEYLINKKKESTTLTDDEILEPTELISIDNEVAVTKTEEK